MASIEQVFLDQTLTDDERVGSILSRLKGVPTHIVEGTGPVMRSVESLKDPIGRGKKTLFLTAHKGRMVTKCPGTFGHICCGYHVLDLMSNCPMDCSYCILQSYLTNPVITVFVNVSHLLDELERAAERASWRFFRVGPGELSDSLALDHLTGFSAELVAWFADQRDKILELKTKSDRVDQLMDLSHRGHTVVSWSLNPESIIRAEEHGTPSLIDRLEGARRCQGAGYPIGLHFDPMVFDGSWEQEYRDMVDQIFQYLDARRVIWISMGCLRFPPPLKPVIEDRFPDSRVLLGELFPGKDGKLRYLETIRVEMFKKMLSWLEDIDPGLFVYLCMETHQVWKAVFGWSPRTTTGLLRRFDERCQEFMNGELQR